MKRLKRFLPYLKPHIKQITLLFVVIVALLLIIVPVPLWERDIIDKVIPASDTRQLMSLVILIASFYSIYFFLNYFRSRLSSSTREKILTKVRIDLYDKLQRMSMQFLARKKSGELLSRILHDAGFVQHLVNDQFFMTIGSGIKVTILIYLMVKIHLQLTVLCLSLLPVVLIILIVFRKKFYRSTLELHRTRADLSGTIQDNLSAMKLIQAETLEENRHRQTLVSAKKLEDVNIRRAKIGITGNLLVSILTYVPLLLLIWGFGGYQIIRSALSLGSLLAYMQYVFAMTGLITNFFNFAMSLQAGYAALDRIFEILDSQEQISDKPEAVPLAESISIIRFDKVSLTFNEDGFSRNTKVLDNIDFQIETGEQIGIVGLTGAGKTSFVDLILQFHLPTTGAILLNHKSIRDFTAKSVRSRIVYIPQQDFFFNDTLRNNMTLGKEYPEEDIYAALRCVSAQDFLESLQDGLNTMVGERGVILSGGQRQQLALARAMLRTADLYIFDEAFSALDLEAEKAVKPYLRERTKDRMAIIIAHRFSILDLVDRVIVMANGRIIEQGSIAELIQAKGLFYNLYEAQQ